MLLFPSPIGSDPSQINVFHYTTNANRQLIQDSGVIKPGTTSGLAWVTPTAYDTGTAAQNDLALPSTPDGYFILPIQNIQTPLIWSPVMPNFGYSGGGIEGTTPASIPIGNAMWISFH